MAELQIIIAQRLNLRTNDFAPGKIHLTDAAAVALTDEGRATISQVRDITFQMRQQQADLLATRQKTAEAKFLFDQTVSLILVGITAIALIFIIAIVLRLEHLRQIVTVCAWTGQVQFEGQWISLEDYLKRRFGVAVSHGLSQEAADEMLQEMRRSKSNPAPHEPARQ